MKKVLILANNDVGLYKFRRELVEALVKEYKVYISLPNGDFVSELEKMGCIYIPTEFNRHGINPAGELRLLKHYKRIIKEIAPDVVLTYTIKPNVYGGMVCAGKRIPYIANITGLGTAVENKGILSLITTTMYRYALRKAKKVFFQNEDNLSYMKRSKIVFDNYDLLPGSGVNIEQYRPLEYPCSQTVNFLFVARVMKEKGIDQYLDAAKCIRKEYPYTRFHICGSCEQDYKEQLEYLQEQDIVEYHGAVKDMVSMYEMSSCTVHPTFYPEGMSNVLLESCASARPIITTDRAGCREIVDDGVNGFICRQQDSEDLIKKLEQFLALTYEERRAMGQRGREKVETSFDRRIVVDKYLREIEV